MAARSETIAMEPCLTSIMVGRLEDLYWSYPTRQERRLVLLSGKNALPYIENLAVRPRALICHQNRNGLGVTCEGNKVQLFYKRISQGRSKVTVTVTISARWGRAVDS